ncbi:hypothetical protein IEQ34_005163 [Dendrobium chrysotoxum]|uniref:Uncharacterized protein n=1 Tax=Dendrobium chrysotoxum TaxID=161865 RepID=A0AAV7GT61_DENCH|nr:hypothetical protein IEQ34_005163 [Dendrobium chrysotoxum]
MHLNGLNFSCQTCRAKGDNHTRLQNTSLDSSNRHSPNASNLVDILNWPLGLLDQVKSFKKSWTLVPIKIGGPLNHVVTLKTRDGYKGDLFRVVTNLLQVGRYLLDNFIIPSLGQQIICLTPRVKASKACSHACFKTTSCRINDKDSTICLRGASDHVLNKVTVSRSINDSAIVLGGLKLPKSNVDCDSTLTFCLQLVKNPSIFE